MYRTKSVSHIEDRSLETWLVGIQEGRLGSRMDADSNEFTEQPRRSALEKDVVKKSFQ